MIGRLTKVFLPTFIFAILSLVSYATASKVFANDLDVGKDGSIRVCKIVVDSDGNITDGSEFPGTKFEISGIDPSPNSEAAPVGVIGTSTFNTPLNLNTDLLYSDSQNDTQCVTYSELALGGYFYGVETITSPNSWQDPKYNDQYTVAVMDLNDFFNYDGNLFDGNPANDDARNKNVDGHIVLNSGRPDRTLVILNVAVGAPAVGGGPTGGVGGSQAPSCPVDNLPQKPDQVWFTDIKPGEVTVHWVNKGDAQGYHLAYGIKPNEWLWGVETGNTDHFTLQNLPQGVDIWVTVIPLGGNKCPGAQSDPAQAVASPQILAGTGNAQNTLTALGAFSLVALGLWQTKNALKGKAKA